MRKRGIAALLLCCLCLLPVLGHGTMAVDEDDTTH